MCCGQAVIQRHSKWRKIQQQQQIRQMGKAQKVGRSPSQTQESDEYRFELKGNPRLFLKQTVSHSFQPVKALSMEHGRPGLATYSIVPKFNFDKKYYSQTFSTEFEGLDPDSKLKNDHKSILRELSTQVGPQNIVQNVDMQLLPKPRTCCICYVCRQEFLDYLQHINSTVHHKALKKAPYNQHIDQLILRVNKTNKRHQIKKS